MHGFKFRRLAYLGEPLGRRLGAALAERLRRAPPETAPTPPIDALIPLPLPWTRRIVRGYNQCEELAGAAGRELGLPVRRPLAREVGLARQTGRRRPDRLRTGGFRVRPFRQLQGQRLLLLDDVYTTGATVRAASRALLGAGAARVDVAVVAWTPPRGPDGYGGPPASRANGEFPGQWGEGWEGD